MESIWQKIADVLLLSRLEKRWQKVARALAIVVVFCTTYMLILPAITIEQDTYCGLEEHIHNDSCYVVESKLICGFDSAEVAEEETTEEPTTEEITTEEATAETATEEVTEQETAEVENIEEETTTEEASGAEFAEETTSKEDATEETTQQDTIEETVAEEETEPSEYMHEHSEECYEYTTTLICTLEEHAHEEICLIEALMYNTNLMSDEDDDEYAVDALADAEKPVTKVPIDTLDSSGGTYYVVYTMLNDIYYALDGDGKAVRITENSDGTIESALMSNNLYWNFSINADNAYVIQNLGTSRHMHSYSNSSTDYGVTTNGNWSSSLVLSENGETFAVKSNSIYSQITTSSGGAAFRTVDKVESAAQFYIAEVYIPQDTYHVWFDGTCGGLMSLYKSPDSYLAVPAESPTITLPATWTSPSKYDYTLNGWYDIKNNKYYKPGAEVTVTKNTVFYADWVASTYDVGIVDDNNVDLVAPSLDTNSFIRTDMFDYSAVFNMQAARHSGTVNATEHSETWTIIKNDTVPYNNMDLLGFTFRDWDSEDVNISYAGSRVRLNNNIGTEITSGIIDYVYDMSGQNIIDLLFNEKSEVLGKNYVGQANYLYQFMEEGSENYDGEHNGYYYYDATLNAASYNQSAQRFYIYDYLERTSDSEKDSIDSNGNPTAAGAYSDFLPFNSPYANNSNDKKLVPYEDGKGNGGNYQYDAKATDQGSDAENAGTNYWFGMKSEIKFFLPDNTNVVDAYQNYGNISSHGKHMTFEFSGDDDMWVFIDGELVMDIGGLHGIMNGKIDFSTGTITTTPANDVLETGTAAEVTKNFSLGAGDHTLTVYYMERGGSQSNCAIYFNITPRYKIELVKQDSVSGEGLDGAVFGVYTDIACGEGDEAVLWTSEEAYLNEKDSQHIFTAKDGKVSFWGVAAGKVYYIKEIQAPAGYPATDDVIRISMNSLGNSVSRADALRGEDGEHTEGFDVVNSSADGAHQQIGITVSNQQSTAFKRNIAVSKKWDVKDKSLIPKSVTVYLTANGKSTGRSAVLSEVNKWTYVWTELPVYDSNDAEINYGVYEEQAEDFYTDIDVSEEELVNAWVQTDAFYDGGTFLIVNRQSGNALSVSSAGNFEWIDFESAKSESSAHWVVNADGKGFHVIDEDGYHIILNETDEFVPDKNGNRILYYNEFALAASYNNTYYYMNGDFTANTQSNLELELYINKDILIKENEPEDDGNEEDEEGSEDEIIVTMYTVTNTPIDEEKKTSFNVTKKWGDGNTNHINDSITVRLYADGVDTGRKLILNHDNSWSGSFEGLLYEDNDGNKIEYTVIEDEIEGYYPEYSEITEEEGGTKEVITYTPAWVPETSLTDGETYVFYNGNYALSRDDTSVTCSSYDENNIKDDQKWLVTVDGSSIYLSDPDDTSSYLYCEVNGSSDIGLTMSSSSKTGFVYSTFSSDKKLSFTYTYNRRSYTRYFRIYNNSLTTTTNSGNGTAFSMMMWGTVETKTEIDVPPSYSITVTNIKVYYILPETGGMGTYHLYIIGGLLISVSSVFLLCLYKKRQRKEGRRLRE